MAIERLDDRTEIFTDSSRRLLHGSLEAAERFNHSYIGTEHRLLGLLQLDDSDQSKKLLNSLKVEPAKIQAAVEFIIGRGEKGAPFSKISITPRAKKIIDLAELEAQRSDSPEISTTHLLMGIVREGQGIAAGCLEAVGIDEARLRTAISKIQGTNLSPSEQTTRPTKEQQSKKPEIVERIDAFYANPNIPEQVKTRMANLLKILVDRAEDSPDLF